MLLSFPSLLLQSVQLPGPQGCRVGVQGYPGAEEQHQKSLNFSFLPYLRIPKLQLPWRLPELSRHVFLLFLALPLFDLFLFLWLPPPAGLFK